MKSTKDTAGLVFTLILLAFLVDRSLGCAATNEVKEVKQVAAEATYLSQQLECVDNLPTKEAIDGCRDSVRRRWGTHTTVSDAGSDR